MKQPENIVRYDGAILRRNGRGWRAEINRNGRRVRRQYRNIHDAKGWVDQTIGDVKSNREPLTPEQVAEYRAAVRLLPLGVSLVEAVAGCEARLPRVEMDLSEAVTLYLNDKRAAGLRIQSIYGMRWALNRLLDAHAGTVGSVTSAKLIEALNGLQTTTRADLRRNWFGFFRWAVAAGYARTNPVEAVATVRTDQPTPAIFTPEAAAALLDAASKYKHGVMVPYIALGLFAGLRTLGILRLDWSAIGDKVITVSPSVEKMRQAREIDIRPTLAVWLAPYRRPSGRVCPVSQKIAFQWLREIRDKAGIEWPMNAMRHSFASYLLAETQDAGRTAYQMGHQSPAILYKHYRKLVSAEAAARYWAILPGGQKVDAQRRAK